MGANHHPARYSSKGFSLIEALLVLAISSIIILGIFSTITSLQKQAKSVDQKVEIIGLNNLLLTALADGSLCSFELTNSGPRYFDSTAVNPEITIPSLRSTALATAPNLIATGAEYSNNILINSIKFADIRSSGYDDEWYVNFVVDMDPGRLVIPRKPIKIPLILNTTGPLNNKQVTACKSTALSRMERYIFHRGTGTNTSTTFYCNPTCNWVVPMDVKGSAFVSLAGGGASALGPRIVSSQRGGSSGGYLMSAPVTLMPGSTIAITVGAGGLVTDDTSFINGSPGGETSFGSLITCSGGGAEHNVILTSTTRTSLYNYGSPGIIFGYINGSDSSYPGVTVVPARPSLGVYGTSGPGYCGPSDYGLGNKPSESYAGASGRTLGGLTPFGYGSGGNDHSSGAQYNSAGTGTEPYPYPSGINGVGKSPENGRNGIVFVDVIK